MKIIVSEKALMRRIKEVMSSGVGWQSTGDLSTSPVEVSSVVDPSAAKTDPGNDNFIPHNRLELKSSIANMIDDISDDDATEFYSIVKDALGSKKEKDEKEMQKNKSSKSVEESIRRSIRRMLNEAGPYRDTGLSYSGPMIGRASPREGFMSCEQCEGEGDMPDGSTCSVCKGTGQVKATGRKNVMMTDVSGASFKDIAQEMGYASESGAKKAVELALQKARQIVNMEASGDLDIIVLSAMNDYVEMLNRTGALTSADVKLMKDHPSIVSQLDGFREYLDGVLRKSRKSGQTLYDPIGR